MGRLLLAVSGMVVATAAVVSSAGGCSLIIPFDPVDAGKQATDPDDDPPPVNRRDSGGPDLTPDPEDASTGVDARANRVPPCDPTFDLQAFDCKYPSGTAIPRPNCAKNDNIFATYPRERTNDLVLCDGGLHPTCVRRCPAGCVVMPNGFADQCDDCEGRPDGVYCGRDLGASPPENANLALFCRNNVGVEQGGRQGCGSTPCGADNCNLSGVCNSTCDNANPGPACCQ